MPESQPDPDFHFDFESESNPDPRPGAENQSVQWKGERVAPAAAVCCLMITNRMLVSWLKRRAVQRGVPGGERGGVGLCGCTWCTYICVGFVAAMLTAVLVTFGNFQQLLSIPSVNPFRAALPLSPQFHCLKRGEWEVFGWEEEGRRSGLWVVFSWPFVVCPHGHYERTFINLARWHIYSADIPWISWLKLCCPKPPSAPPRQSATPHPLTSVGHKRKGAAANRLGYGRHV